MKTTLLLLALLLTTSAFAQSSATKKPKKATEDNLPVMTEAQARAAASTNLAARCALDFRWRDLTNKIGLQQKQVDKAAADLKAAQERANLAVQARQTKNRNPDYVQNARAAQKNQEAALATLKLQLHDIEEANRKLMLPSR